MIANMTYAERGANKWFRGYNGRLPIDRDEFVSSAYLGLVEAARTFDPNRGTQFTTWAFSKINNRLGKTVREYRRQNGWAYNHLQGHPDKKNGRMERVLKHVGWPTVIGKDGDETPWDAPAPTPDPETIRSHERREHIRGCVLSTARTPRERKILEGRLAGRTLGEIGDELGITRERVRQIYQAAMHRAKQILDPDMQVA